jgi:hypothetical protein
MKKYEENSLDQPNIENHEFYWRYQLDYHARTVYVSTSHQTQQSPSFSLT